MEKRPVLCSGSRAIHFQPHVHFSRQRIRRMSAALLLVWLCTLFAGIAHACVTQAVVAVSHEHEHCQEAAANGADGQEAPSPSQAACYKLCSEATAPTLKSPSAQNDASPLPLVDALALGPSGLFNPPPPMADAPSAASRLDGPHWRGPIPIVYLRLAL